LHHSSGDSAYPLISELKKQNLGISKPQSIALKKKEQGINNIAGNKTNAQDDQQQTEN
jgi:hypothetical protein